MKAMSDEFLDWVRRRRQQLHKELAELDAAERIYLRSGIEPKSQAVLPLESAPRSRDGPKLTIKEMVLEVLKTAPAYGLTANEILERINRMYELDLVRTSLSPQLSRLRQERRIESQRPYWRLATHRQESVSMEGADSPE